MKRQKIVCKRNLEVMDAVKSGAGMAVEECRHQFRDRRWNCSSVVESTVFHSMVNTGKVNTGKTPLPICLMDEWLVDEWLVDGCMHTVGTGWQQGSYGWKWSGNWIGIEWMYAGSWLATGKLWLDVGWKLDWNWMNVCRELELVGNREVMAGRGVGTGLELNECMQGVGWQQGSYGWTWGGNWIGIEWMYAGSWNWLGTGKLWLDVGWELDWNWMFVCGVWDTSWEQGSFG